VNRRLVLGVVGAAVVILAFWYLALWNPSHNDLKKAQQRTAEAKAQQAQLEAAVNRLRSAQKDEPLQRAKLESLRTAIPDTPNLAQFILDANDAASKAGIDFISITPTPPAAVIRSSATTPTTAAATTTTTAAATATTATTTPVSTGPAEINLQLQIKGGYFQVLDFLNRLDRLPRLTVVDGVNITGDDQGVLTVNLTGRMFVRSVPPGFPGGVATTTTTTAPAAGASTTTTAAAGASTTTTAPGGRP